MTSLAQKKRSDSIMTALFVGGAGFAVVLLVAFVGFVIIQGVEGMTPEMLSFAPMAWAICSLTRCTSSFWLSSAV